MLLNIIGASLEEISEALGLLDGVSFTVEAEREQTIDSSWRKLPNGGSQRQSILLTFLTKGDRTRDDFRLDSDLSDGSIDPRIHELEQGGHLVKTGEYRETQYGRRAAVLTVTESTRKAINRAPRVWFPNAQRVG